MIRVEQLWRTCKGIESTNLDLYYGGDSPGYPFTVCPHGERLLFCNDSYLLDFRIVRNRLNLENQFRISKGSWWGVGCKQGEALAIRDGCISTKVCFVRIDLAQKRMQVLSMEPPNISPPVRFLWGAGDRMIIASADEAFELDREGRIINRYATPYGIAVDAQGSVVVPNEKLPKPKVVEAQNGQLIGIDRRNRLYWIVSDYQHRRTFSYHVDTLIVSNASGGVEQAIVLNGVRGVIHFLRDESQIGWVEITPQGEVYVLGWRWRGRQDTVGIWRLTL